MKKILITGSGGPLGVNVTRSLKQAPDMIFTVGTEANPHHIPLSITDRTEKIPFATDIDNYLNSMKRIEEKYEIDLIIPTHPVEVITLSKFRDKFPGKLFLPSHKAIETGNDKFLSYKAWENEKIAVPRTILITKEKDLKDAFDLLGSESLWLRGAGSPGTGIGGRALLCKSVAQAKAWIDYWDGWAKFICSEYLPGDNMTWTSLWKTGRLIASQGRQRLEYVLPHVSQSGITGAPAVSKTVIDHGMNRLGEKAVKSIDKKPQGTFFVDFKRDDKGKLKITEINPGRFGTTIHFYTEAGVNFPYLYLKLAFGEELEDVKKYDCIKEDLYWIRTLDCGPVMLEGKDLGK